MKRRRRPMWGGRSRVARRRPRRRASLRKRPARSPGRRRRWPAARPWAAGSCRARRAPAGWARRWVVRIRHAAAAGEGEARQRARRCVATGQRGAEQGRRRSHTHLAEPLVDHAQRGARRVVRRGQARRGPPAARASRRERAEVAQDPAGVRAPEQRLDHGRRRVLHGVEGGRARGRVKAATSGRGSGVQAPSTNALVEGRPGCATRAVSLSTCTRLASGTAQPRMRPGTHLLLVQVRQWHISVTAPRVLRVQAPHGVHDRGAQLLHVRNQRLGGEAHAAGGERRPWLSGRASGGAGPCERPSKRP